MVQTLQNPLPSHGKKDSGITVQLPPERLRFLESDRYRESDEALVKDFKLSEPQMRFIRNLDRLALAGHIDLDVYLTAIADELKLPAEQSKTLHAKLLADRFAPFNDRISPSAAEIAKTHQLDLPPTPHYRVYAQPLTYSGVVSEVAETAGISLAGRALRPRLRDLIIAKTRGTQVDTQILEVMTRGEAFGGMGFDPKTASAVLAAMNDILGRATVLSEDAYGEWLAEQTKARAKPTGAESAEGESEDAARGRIEGELQEKKRRVDTTVERAVQDIISGMAYRPPSPYLERRLRNAVSSRLRDVRSARDFRDVLTRPDKVGGVGMDADLAEKVSRQMEEGYIKFHGDIAEEEKKRLDEQIRLQRATVDERRKRRAEEHAKWFEQKMRRSEMPRMATPPPGAATMEKPSVDAVRHERPRLVGLLGELAALTRQEFRRMGETPDAAAEEVKEKIETVGKDSAKDRIRAVEAFRASPIHAEYVALVGESFKTQTPIADVIAKRRAKGEDVLTPEEIAAIIQLNSKLHY